VTRRTLSGRTRYLIQLGVVALAYTVTAWLGLHLSFTADKVTMVWPPTGVALAALVLGGPRMVPGVFAGALIAEVGIFSPHIALGIAAGNTAAALAGFIMLRAFDFRGELDRPRDVFVLVFAGGFGGTAISATTGTAMLDASGRLGGTVTTWLHWWIGDVMGVVLIAPLILTFVRVRPNLLRSRWHEGILVLGGTIVAGAAILAVGHPIDYLAPLVFAAVPLVAAMRFEQPGAALASMLMAAVSIAAAIKHPVSPELPVTTRLLVLQAFNGGMTLMGLVLAAVMRQRSVAEQALVEAALRLTERVQERTELLSQSQRLARIGSFRWDAVTSTNIWSDELYRIHELEPREFAPGPDYTEFIHPDDLEALHLSLQQMKETLEPYEFDYRIVLPSGTEKWILARGEPITDADGNFVGLQGTCQDITDRTLSEERFRLLVESAAFACVVVNADGCMVLVNDELASLFGYTANELIGRPVEMLIPHDLRDQHARNRHVYAENAHSRPMGSGLELWGLRKDGTKMPIDINLSPIPASDGLQVVAAVRDITAQREIEDKLRHAYEQERDAAEHLRRLDESKTVFLEAVSHELRTPLTVILGTANLLQTGDFVFVDPQTKQLVRSLDKSAHRLSSLLDDLLDLDRLRRGVAAEPKRRPTAVGELTRRIVQTLEVETHPIDVATANFEGNVDPAQTERIVENLIMNAVKHTPEGTQIWITAEPAENGTSIVVEDAGPGVPDHIRDALFEPFVKETRGHVPGTGIGLSLVMRFAQLHGGRAWVTDRPGGGASFHVYLPNDSAHDHAAA